MSGIVIHDTRSGELRELRGPEQGTLGIYACGPTVYGRIHVGNARPFVVFSLLRTIPRHEGYDVEPGRQHHRCQRQDLRGRIEAPANPSAELAGG